MFAHRARVIAMTIAVSVLALRPDASVAKKPPACASGRFLVVGPSIVTGDASHGVEPLALGGGRLALADACAATKARLKRTKRGTVLRATWKSCAGFKGRVRLGGTITPDCGGLSGTLVARKSKVKRAFTALATKCGDGLIDVGAGEGCEPPGSLTCTGDCQAVSAPPPAITIDTPSNFALTNAAAVDVTGTVSPSVVGVACNGVVAPRTGAAFSAHVPLTEGHNTIVCVASAADARAATASVNVSRDGTGPRIGITSPKPGATFTASPVTAAGFVNDLVAADLTTAEPTVVCNGVTAVVANRTFVASGIPIAAGPATITCDATDPAGNTTATHVDVTLTAPVGPAIHRISGDGQTGTIGATLAAPLVVALDDGGGQPVAGKTVVFRVVENDGALAGGSGTPRAIMVTSGADGRAAATFMLGTRAGAGNQQVRATSVGFAGEVVFTASATVGPAARIVVDSGNLQEGLVGQALPRPFVATLIDAGNNRLAGVPVTFTVEAGGGSIDDPTVVTDLDGRAHAFLTLGPTLDRDGQVAAATFAGNAGASARFVATALAGGDPAATRISGVVLDGSNVPVPNVLVGIGDTSISTMTDIQGQFTIEHAPVGRVDLWVVGSTTTRSGVWPSIPYELVTVPGEDNGIGMPIHLPELDVAHGVQVDETHGGTVAPPDLPGFTLTIAPGSATFPDGTHKGLVTVTAVHPDKVPMIPQFGQQPRVIVTIQPAGTRFDPPAALTMPNADGLPPGQKTELFSFDHDLRSFLTIGTGTVSEDGSIIRSDPGVGVVKAGWHCGGNPTSIGTCDHQCDDGNDCTDDTPKGGQCVPIDQRPGSGPDPKDGSKTFCRDQQLMNPCPAAKNFGFEQQCWNHCGGLKGQDCTQDSGDRQGVKAMQAALGAVCNLVFGSGGCMPADLKKQMADYLKSHEFEITCKDTAGADCGDYSGGNSAFIPLRQQVKDCGPLDKTIRHELQHASGTHHVYKNGKVDCANDPVYGCDVACYGSANCAGAKASNCRK